MFKLRSIANAIINYTHKPEISRPFGRWRNLISIEEVGSMWLPLYPAMFPPILYCDEFQTYEMLEKGVKFKEREETLMATIQTKPYFKMSVDKRYMAIEKGESIS